MKTEQAKAQGVWQFFREISQIPRPSGHEERICGWLIEFANSNGLQWRSDPSGNTIIELEATAGYENSAGLVIQSHVDMVCAKLAGVEHDFNTDPIKLIEKDGWVCADGTTLGADDGIGVAMALALAVEEGLEHGPIELLFTVGEEAGLIGAQQLTNDFVKGRKLINLDSEDDVFTVGCTGGEQSDITLPIQFCDVEDGWVCCKLSISGLHGGHSGVDIHRGRANAIRVMARLVNTLTADFDIKLTNIEGGSAHNAIPINANSEFFINTNDLENIKSVATEFEKRAKEEFSKTDASLVIEIKQQDAEHCKAMTDGSANMVIKLLLDMPDGVDRFSDEFEGVVETSSNLAIVQTSLDESAVIVKSSKRSCKEAGLERMRGKIETTAAAVGACVKRTSKYPAWEPDLESELLKNGMEIYERLHGNVPVVEVIHAGLECGLIGKLYAGMDMISIGPTIENPHSPRERVNVASVDDAWALLIELVKTLK